MQFLSIIVVVFLLMGCQSTTPLNTVYQVEKLIKKVQTKPHDINGIIEQTQRSKQAFNSDVALIQSLLKALGVLVEKEWGKDEAKLPSQKEYVKYSNHYQARAIVNFEQGTVTVETIAAKQITAKLKQAIIATLLTPADPRNNDIFSDKSPLLGTEPFLYQQVLDQENKAVRYQWRASRFAQYLIDNNLTKRQTNNSTIYQVRFPLVNNHQRFRQLQYSDYVLASAKRYHLAPELIYAIIETESSFNPYAVSTANAYGLMQIVPSTAGKDVYQKIKKRSGQPSKATLFNPQHNIDIGSAYLSILNKHYLTKINDYQNKEYAVISAYNGGAGNVLKTFNSHRNKAIKAINSLTPKSVYWALTNKHPKIESRKYLQKVVVNKAKY